MKKIKPSSGFLYIYLLFGFLFCLALYYGFFGGVDNDEIEAVHTAWKILQGEVIYRGFFQHHHPLFYYALVPIIQIGGENIFTFYLAEIFAFLIFSGIVITTFLLAEKIYNDRKISWFAVILLLTFPFFIFKGTEIRPDILQVLLGLLSIYFLVIYLKNEGTKKHFFASAILLSLSFLVLQKAIFLIFVIGIFLLYCMFNNGGGGVKITIKDFMLYWLVFSILPALYAIFLLATGTWQNYVDFNWWVNLKLQRNFSPLVHFFPLSQEIFANRNVYSSQRIFATLMMAGFVFLFIRVFKTGKIDRLHGFVVLAGVVLGISVFLVKVPYSPYFLAFAPFVAMVSAFALCRLFSERAAKMWLGVFVLLCAFWVVWTTGSGGVKKSVISKLQYVLSVTAPEDLYFGYRRNLFRKDASFFWFCMEAKKCTDTYSGFRDYDFDPVGIVKKTRPKVIHAPGRWEGFYTSIIEHPEVAPNYEESSEHPKFYIRKDGL